MPRTLKAGDKLRGYTISNLINKGAMAIAYSARTADGQRVFLKQYKSPTITVPWYKGYVEYQAELKRRVETSRAVEYCYKFVEFFEEDVGHKCYFQAFEFIDKGQDLEKTLDQIRARPNSYTWEQRLTLAKVLMASIHAIHESKIIHSDLKPPNIYLFKDDTIAAKYRLKLVDMDYSVLSDRKAPWDGFQGYVGSPNYFSPEHLANKAPTTASDVFTCGLMIYELLAQGHPYRSDDDEQYKAAVLGYRAEKPKLVSVMPAPASNEQVVDYLYRSLSPNPADRPTARDLNLALNGRLGAGLASSAYVSPTPTVTTAPAPGWTPASRTASTPTVAATEGKSLELAGEGGKTLRIGIRTEIGRDLCKVFGEDSRFWSVKQAVLEKDASGNWTVTPCAEAANATLLNGKTLTTATALTDGDALAVGREEKGIVKLPLKVRII